MSALGTLCLLSMLAQAPPAPTPPAGTGTQRVAEPIERRPTEEMDDRTRADLKSQREIDNLRRGPDAHRDQILQRQRLQPVDAGVEDRSTLDVSLRNMQPELSAMPTGFSRVYVDPVDPEQYVRADGALYAVFPFSEYKRTKKGTLVLIPTSTIFRIGRRAHFPMMQRPDPFMDAAPERIDARSPVMPSTGERMDTRVNLFRGTGQVTTSTPAVRANNESRDASRVEQDPTSGEGDRAISQNEPRDEPDFANRTLPEFLTNESYRRAFFESLRERRPTKS